MNFVPYKGFIALKLEDPAKQTETGIYLPDDREQGSVTIAECVSVGLGVDSTLVGKRLIIGRFNGTEVHLGDGDYLFVEAQYILGESVDD